MIRKFTYDGVTVSVKTNMIKNGDLYFGEKNVSSELESSIKETWYELGKGKYTIPEYLLSIDRKLRIKGISPTELSCGDIVYNGTKMTDLTKQAEL